MCQSVKRSVPDSLFYSVYSIHSQSLTPTHTHHAPLFDFILLSTSFFYSFVFLLQFLHTFKIQFYNNLISKDVIGVRLFYLTFFFFFWKTGNWFVNFNLRELYCEFSHLFIWLFDKLDYVIKNLGPILSVTFWISNRMNLLIVKVLI